MGLPASSVVTTVTLLGILAKWVAVVVWAHLTPAGKHYLCMVPSAAAQDLFFGERANNLTAAALVFAGLTLVNPPYERLTNVLVAAIVLLIVAWAVGTMAGQTRAIVIGDGLQWLGMGCFLAAVYDYAGTTAWPLAQVLGLLGLAVFSALSGRRVWIHVRTARANLEST
jgi:hypothetical protein